MNGREYHSPSFAAPCILEFFSAGSEKELKLAVG